MWNFLRLNTLIAVAMCFSFSTALKSGEFEAASPESTGIHSIQLRELSEWVRRERLDVRSMIVLREGRLVLEWYSGGVTRAHNHNIYSVTKSVVSTLAGIAIEEKAITGTNSSLGELFSEISNPDMSRVTLEGLLTMRSGMPQSRANRLTGPERELFDQLQAAPNRLESIFELPLIGASGSIFRYGNIEPQLILAAVERQTGKNGLAYAQAKLFQPLNFKNAEWVYADKAGNLPGGYGLRLRAVDLAKLGQLFIQNGQWDGQQIISPDWVKSATSDQIGTGYGYYWWILRPKKEQSAYAAKGVRGQQIYVDPSQNLVFVVTSDLPPSRVPEVMKELNKRLTLAVEDSGVSLPEDSRESQKLAEELKKAENYLPIQRSDLIPARLPRLP